MSKAKETPLPDALRARLQAMDGSSDADAWRSLGNDCFANGSYLSAIRCYTRALESSEDTAVIRSNRSAAYLKSSMFAGPSLALKDAEAAVRLEPAWCKAHLRVGDAQFARGKYVEAKEAYERAVSLDGGNKVASESLRLVERELFLRSLDEAAKEKERKEQQAEWSAESTLSGNTGMTSTKSGSDRPPTVGDEIERDIQSWATDTTLREDRTAMRAFNARLDEADRTAGVMYKSELLSKFRGKLEAQESLRRKVEERRDREMRLGEGIDYRNADSQRSVLMKGTNGVGLGISTDAYKSYKYESKMW